MYVSVTFRNVAVPNVEISISCNRSGYDVCVHMSLAAEDLTNKKFHICSTK